MADSHPMPNLNSAPGRSEGSAPAEIYMIASYPQILATCTSVPELHRRLREMRHLQRLSIRRLTRNGWEDITHQFERVLQMPPAVDPG